MKYFIALIIAGTFFSAAPLWAVETESAPAIKISFDGDDSLAAKELKPSAMSECEGRFGKAVKFSNAKAQRDCGTIIFDKFDAELFAKPFTVSLWMKRGEKAARDKAYEIICNAPSEKGPGLRVRLFYEMIQVITGDGKKLIGINTNPVKTPVNCSVWYHLAITFDGNQAKVYLDGELAATSENGLTFGKGKTLLTVGSYNAGYSYGYEGALDEILIYRHALSHKQIINQAKLGR